MKEFTLSAFADEASWSAEGQIAALQRNHIRYIEMRSVNGKGIAGWESSVIRELRKQYNDAGITVFSIGSWVGKIKITDDFEPHLESFKQVVQAAHLLGTDRIRLFSFYIPDGCRPEEFRDQVLDRMGRLLDIADSERVVCCHENEKDIYGDVFARCMELYQHFGGRLKAVFDPANYVQCGERPDSFIDAMLPYVDYIHIKDALLDGGAVVPAGAGDGGVPAVIDRFAATDGLRVLSVEPHLKVFKGLDNMQQEPLRNTFEYRSQDEAFDAAVGALKAILDQNGYTYR